MSRQHKDAYFFCFAQNYTAQSINGVLYSALAKYSGIVVSLIITAFLARILAPTDFGIVAIATIFINFFSTITTVGIAPAIIQNKELTNEELVHINTIVIILSFIITALYICFIPLITTFYDNTQYLSNILYILSISIFTAIAAIVPNALIMKDKKFKFIAIRTFVVQISVGVLSLVLAYKGLGIYSLLVNPVIGNIIILIINYKAQPIGLTFHVQLSPFRKIFSYSINQMLFNFMYLIYRNIDKIIIGKVFSVHVLGYYEKSYRLMMLPLENISHVINPVLHPVLSDYQNDKEYLWRSYLNILGLLSEIGCFISVTVYYFSYIIINIIYGEQWLDAIPYFKILSIGIGAQIMQAPVGAILQSINKVKGLFYSSVIVTFLLIIFVGTGAYLKNLTILCWSITICFCIAFIVYQIFIVHYFKKSIKDIVNCIYTSLISSMALFLILAFANVFCCDNKECNIMLVYTLIIILYQSIIFKIGLMPRTSKLINGIKNKKK